MVMLRIDEQIWVDILVEVYIFGIISQDWEVALKDLGIIGDSVHRNSLLRWDTKGMEPKDSLPVRVFKDLRQTNVLL